MEWTGQVESIEQDFITGKIKAVFSINEGVSIANWLNTMKDQKLAVKMAKFSEKRSKDANALMWHCLGQIADALSTDNWSVYLQMLKRYGQYTYICVKPKAVEYIKKQWRECEVVGEVDINGQESVQMLCYYGSSTYNSKEFSRLLEGIISEMKDLGLQPPTSEEMRASLEKWQKENG